MVKVVVPLLLVAVCAGCGSAEALSRTATNDAIARVLRSPAGKQWARLFPAHTGDYVDCRIGPTGPGIMVAARCRSEAVRANGRIVVTLRQNWSGHVHYWRYNVKAGRVAFAGDGGGEAPEYWK
jgi:hypothetical protein